MRYLLICIMTLVIGNVTAQVLPVMTYNIRYATDRDGENSWEKRKEAMFDLLQNYKPAIIGTQEGLTHQLRFLCDELGSYDYIGVARDDGRQKGEYSAILYDTTRFQVIRENTFWLHESGDQDSIGWDAAMKRICTYGLFEEITTRKQFWVFNAHFDHVGKLARERSAEMMVSYVQRINTANLPVVVMGDFNSEPDTPPIEQFKAGLSDGLKIADKKQKEPLGTFTAYQPDAALDRRIDYIFVKNFKVKEYYHLNERRKDGYFISDHLPVLAILRY